MSLINTSVYASLDNGKMYYSGLDAFHKIQPKYINHNDKITIGVPFSSWQLIEKQPITEDVNYYTYFIPFNGVILQNIVQSSESNFGIFFKNTTGVILYAKEINVATANSANIALVGNQSLWRLTRSTYEKKYLGHGFLELFDSGILGNPLLPDFSAESLDLCIFAATNEPLALGHSVSIMSKYGSGIYVTCLDSMLSILSQSVQITYEPCEQIQYYQNVNNNAHQCFPISITQIGKETDSIYSYTQLPAILLRYGFTYTISAATCSGNCGDLKHISNLPIHYSITQSPESEIELDNLFTYRLPNDNFSSYTCNSSSNEFLHIWAAVQNSFLSDITLSVQIIETQPTISVSDYLVNTKSFDLGYPETGGADDWVYPHSIYITLDGGITDSLEHLAHNEIYVTDVSPQPPEEEELEEGYSDEILNEHLLFIIPISAHSTIEWIIPHKDEYNNATWYLTIAGEGDWFDNIQVHNHDTVCLYKDTKITLYDNTQKEIQYLDPDTDILMGKNKQPNKIVKIDHSLRNIYKTLYYFSDNTVITTTNKHRFYNIDQQFYQYLHLWKIGERAQKIDGSTPALVRIETIQEDCECWGLWTEDNTYWAEELLSSETQANEECMEEATPQQLVNIMSSMTSNALQKGLKQ